MVEPDKLKPDQLAGVLHPRENTRLFGHQNMQKDFLDAYHKGTLHHAWLLLGREGIGKATLAYHFAKAILLDEDKAGEQRSGERELDLDNRDVQLIVKDAHPNLLILRRSWNTKTKKFRTQITVDDVRELQKFLGNTAGMGKWRIIIIDRADDLNVNAANALLKMLEEPPEFCLFQLISSEPGKLPVTIRSRCQKLRLGALPTAMLKKAVMDVAAKSGMPPGSDERMDAALKLARGSVRQALEFSSGRTLEDFREVEQILDLLPRMDAQKTVALAERLSIRKNDLDYHRFVQLLSGQLASRIKQLALQGKAEQQGLAQWAKLWETVTIKKNEVDLLNLDRGNFILDMFAQIEEVALEAGGLSPLPN